MNICGRKGLAHHSASNKGWTYSQHVWPTPVQVKISIKHMAMPKDREKTRSVDCCIPRAIHPAKKKRYINPKPIKPVYRLHQTEGESLTRRAFYSETTVCSKNPVWSVTHVILRLPVPKYHHPHLPPHHLLQLLLSCPVDCGPVLSPKRQLPPMH